jgi:hypothetical protein
MPSSWPPAVQVRAAPDSLLWCGTCSTIPALCMHLPPPPTPPPTRCLHPPPTSTSTSTSFVFLLSTHLPLPLCPQIPNMNNTPAASKGQAVLMYTGSDKATADSLAAGLLSTPNITASTLAAAQAYLTALGSPVSANGTVYAEVLSLLGLQYATAIRPNSLYLDQAFVVGG